MTENNGDLALMQSIRDRWKAAIDAAVTGTAIPAKFLAALIANETGGNPDAIPNPGKYAAQGQKS